MCVRGESGASITDDAEDIRENDLVRETLETGMCCGSQLSS